jgi:hypothetical protein
MGNVSALTGGGLRVRCLAYGEIPSCTNEIHYFYVTMIRN